MFWDIITDLFKYTVGVCIILITFLTCIVIMRLNSIIRLLM